MKPNKVLRLRLIFFLICLIISILYNSTIYFKKKISYNDIKNRGKIAQVYIKYVSKKDAPWYYGTQIRLSYFITMNGDTINSIDKTASEYNYTLPDYIPFGKVIYDPRNPRYFIYTDDLPGDDNISISILSVVIQVIFNTIFLFIGLGVLMIILRRNSNIDLDYLRWSALS